MRTKKKKVLPKIILQALRKGLMRHYQAGFEWHVENHRKEKLCVRNEVMRFYRERRQQLVQAGQSQSTTNDENNNEEEKTPKAKAKATLLHPTCQEWWRMLKFLLVYTTTRDTKSLTTQHVFHVALSIPACPPSILELIVAVHPYSRRREDPRSGALPLHIVCRHWKGGGAVDKKKNPKNNRKEPNNPNYSAERVLMSMAMGEYNSHFVWRRFEDRLPLHHAVAAGKAWSFLEPLVKTDPQTLLARDPLSKLFPFQMAATSTLSATTTTKSKAVIQKAKNQLLTVAQWQKLSLGEQNDWIEKVAQEQGLRQLRTIYELLRHNPNAIAHGAIVRGRREKTNKCCHDIVDAGIVTSHWISWCYLRKQTHRGNGWWIQNTGI